MMAENLNLRPDEFAFYFEGVSGVDADALASFLKRAATVARRHGGDLMVVGFRKGSLAVIVRAIAKSKIAKNAIEEFEEKPIEGTVKVATICTAIAGAIAAAIFGVPSITKGGDEPLSNAAANIIENHGVHQISVVTNNETTVIMNAEIAAQLEEYKRYRVRHGSVSGRGGKAKPSYQRSVGEMKAEALDGNLVGDVRFLDGELHFRPDGYRYFVPIYLSTEISSHGLSKVGRYRVGGFVSAVNGQPDHVVFESAILISE